MGSGIYDFYFHHDPAEVSKCMLCYDPECSKACPQSADIGGIIRSLYFQDYMAAVRKLSCDCIAVDIKGTSIIIRIVRYV